MKTINVKDRDVNVDADGYLLDYKDWDRDVALVLAGIEKIEMTEDHWIVVNLLRDYYAIHEVVPTTREFLKLLGEKAGQNKGNAKFFAKLFPNEPGKLSGKVAGLPKLTGCM
ncbi:TusE/DsrC/DsvC family sulfur relay protein [bacterium]|nr:TusE/DsrC/DsvC family sulfur relay protein [bacterium]